MHLFFNDRSMVRQAANPYVADELLLALANLLRALEPRLINDDVEGVELSDSIYKHVDSKTQQICEGVTLNEWLFEHRHYDDDVYRRELFSAKQYLNQRLTSNPFIETILTDIDHICVRQPGQDEHDLTGTIIAGAAEMGGILFSVDRCEHFPDGPVTVLYWKGDDEPQDTEIEHYATQQGVRNQRRQFDRNAKHDASRPTYGVRGTEMDLSDEEAGEILNAGILIGKRVFGRGADGQIYVFPSHRPNVYHGYPVDVAELQKRVGYIYSRLRNRGWVR